MNKLYRTLFCFSVCLALAGCSKDPASQDADHPGHKHAPEVKQPVGSTGTRTNPAQQSVHAAGTCSAHGAPSEQCFICDPTLRDKGRLWCNEHDRYEDRCWLCHPEAKDKDRLYCDEHGLYEDECFICHPEAKPASQAGAEAGPSNDGLMCGEHNLLEAECGICHPELIGALKPGEAIKVRLPGLDSAKMAGVTTGTAEKGGVDAAIECVAEVVFDQNKFAQIAAPVSGTIHSADVDLGAKISDGQTVARIWSATIAEAVAKAVLTHQTLERERRLRAERVTSESDLQRAQAEHRAACQQARTLGFSEDQIDAFGANPDEPVMLEVRAPFSGEIIERSAVRGALIEAGKPLFTLADRSSMWAMLSIPEAALSEVREGQTVQLRTDSLPHRIFTGKLTWIASKVDDRTRMVSARVELSNPEGALRANMFARARIITRDAGGALVIPVSAVQRVEGQPLVFVKLAEDLYEARAVKLGAQANGKLEVLEGLEPQESLVLAQGFSLKSQLLISRLGAGCAHE